MLLSVVVFHVSPLLETVVAEETWMNLHKISGEIGVVNGLTREQWRSLGYEVVGRQQQLSNTDKNGALDKLQSLFGLGRHSMHDLLRRKSRLPGEAFRRRLRVAHLELLKRSVRRDLEKLKIERAKGSADADLESLVAEAETLLARIEEKTVW